MQRKIKITLKLSFWEIMIGFAGYISYFPTYNDSVSAERALHRRLHVFLVSFDQK